MGQKIVKNYPSPRLMETIGATNQKPSEAIGELVANCFDAKVDGEKMIITVDMRDQKIIVTDNGRGMTEHILEKAVCKIPDIRLYGDYSKDRTAIAALNLGDCDAGTVADALAVDYEIATRAGAHCAPRMHRALGTERQGAVRFSFGYFNSEEDVDAAVRALKEIAER